MTKAAIHLAFFALATGALGCTFIARGPDDYRKDTRAVLEQRQADVKTCYDAALKADPGAKGIVAVKFKVEKETGKIVNAAIAADQTSAPAALGECVVKSLNGLVLDPPDKRDGEGTFVWDFQPGTAPAPVEAAPAAG
ncbi:MAG: AgmX/PglI C-terminal domain-containing protein [Polyangiaceae bacterium]|nr:AgmX/PglI C-terminal domain-containing protein [Polyangiaceae bacterium]